MTASFFAGANAANNGTHISNSYPWNHEEFVRGYQSVRPEVRENRDMKHIWTKARLSSEKKA